MTTIKEALISRLKKLPDDITLNEILKIIRDEWQFSKYKKKSDKIINDKSILSLKSKFESDIEKFHEGIISLKENWNKEGAKEFDDELWNKSSELLREILFYLWENNITVPIPAILPCSDGSLDINWETEKFELLVNIPPDHQELVSIYGEKLGHKGDEIEVRIKFDLIKPVIVEWLRIIL